MTDNSPILPALVWGASTHPGRVRGENEDAYFAEPQVFGVADGMGGHQAGEVASAIAAATVRDRLAGGASPDVMIAAVVEANAAIFQAAHSHSEQRGMGTTLTVLAVVPPDGGLPRVVVANVGDSRTYVLRGEMLRRITVDHSYVQELVNTGHISEHEARSHPRRNIVTRALGIEPTVRVDTTVLPLVRGDRYLLCSDGLVDEVDDEDIAEILAAHEDPQAAADALVDAANTSGGRDNVTVVVVDVLDGGALAPDAAEIDADFGEWDGEHERLIDAEAGTVTIVASDHEHPAGSELRAGGDVAALTDFAGDEQATMMMPAIAADSPPAAPRKSRRSPLGVLLFLLALGVIVTVTVVLVLVVQHNSGNEDVPTTTVEHTTTTVRVTTTTRPSTTSASPSTSGP